MENKYSPSLNTFFLAEFMERYQNAGSLPADAVPVSDAVYTEFSQEPSDGLVRIAGEDGFPAWVKTPPPTHEEEIEVAEQYRQGLLIQADTVTADWRTMLMLGEINDVDKEKLSIWMDYKKTVKAVDTSTAPDINWPDQPEV